MTRQTRVVIGLGANLGDPIEQLLEARHRLHGIAADASLLSSHFYLSSPIGYDQQPFFVNAAVSLNTDLSAHDCLKQLQEIENKLGRLRDPMNQNAARTIDLDILLYGDQRINDTELVLPHPRMAQRLFVLTPLAEIMPEALIYVDGMRVTVQALLQDVSNHFINQECYKLSL